MAACGTHRGYRSHRRRAERPCDPCRLAYNAYRQRLRAAGPESARQQRRDYQAAYNRALARLRAEHLGRFAQLLNEELAAPDVQAEAVAA
jgi:hypothetical protein